MGEGLWLVFQKGVEFSLFRESAARMQNRMRATVMRRAEVEMVPKMIVTTSSESTCHGRVVCRA